MSTLHAELSSAMLSEFELARLERIEQNKKRMLEMGITGMARDLAARASPQKTPRKLSIKYTRRPITPESERRRSSRERTKISYVGMDDGAQDKSDRGYTKPARAPTRAPRAVFSVGGRVYDSERGVTCHWCRQKTVETHVACTGEACQGARLPLSFCGMCLRNRHGEDIDDAVASGCWQCPRCRGSCGEGCVTCCNCGPCRKKAGLAPTHQVIQLARASGFDNVHDYLVSQTTREGPKEIAARKLSFPWGKWLRDDFCAPCAADPESESEERQVDVAAGSSADDESAQDIPSPFDSDDDSSGSDDDQFMVVRRTPTKRPAASPRAAASPKKKARPSIKTPVKKPIESIKSKTAPPTPEPIAHLGEDVYEFERVLARRKRGRGEQLLIKWRGFGEDEATWEPARNIITHA